MIVRDKELIASGITPAFLIGCIKEHELRAKKMQTLYNAYASKPPILSRVMTEGLPNNKLVHNYGRYIVSVSSGYLVGNPISYQSDEKIDHLIDAYQSAKAETVDAELAKDAALFGKGVELCFSDDKALPKVATLDPRSAFVVYGNDILSTPLLGVRYYTTYGMDGTASGVVVEAYTETETLTYQGKDTEAAVKSAPIIEPHFFGGVPMVEYWNNDDETGDFEHVQTLIDAYDILQSDRVNDKEQLVDALLVITGAKIVDEPDITDPETGDVIKKGRTAAQQIRQDRMLYLPYNDVTAEYLIKNLTESDVEILKDSIKSDIHKFAMVPDLSDVNFAGNASGVAMKYKLFGLEQLTKTKERWFKEGLQERMRLFLNFLEVKGAAKVDQAKVDIVFKRSLPANEMELAQMVATLRGSVPTADLLAQLPFINDPNEAMKALGEEKQEALKQQQAAFGMPLPMVGDDA